MAHISDHPEVLGFLTHYWWETADLVYGKGGISAATQQYMDDHTEAASRRLSADLMRLATTDFVREHDWDSPAYVQFWEHSGVHRVLVTDDIARMLKALPGGTT